MNAKRAAEEANGRVRWLRPEFQKQGLQTQGALDVAVEGDTDDNDTAALPVALGPKRAWPSGLAEQVKAVADVVTNSTRAMSLADLEQRFTARGRWRDRLPLILETLEALGRARQIEGGFWQRA